MIFAVITLILCAIVLIYSFVLLVFRYRKFKDLRFYSTWNTFVFEMNPLFKRPPLYNFLFLLKNLFFAGWISFNHNNSKYDVKLAVLGLV